jgi:16S rRNA (guanine966-N2)-methyltransferase
MRIVAGTAKGRKLTVPKGLGVRPTTDRVREALFSSIGARIRGASILDLFAGTGALGLESLSRGAASAVFVERHKAHLAVLGRNIATCGFTDRCRLVDGDSMAALKQLQREGRTFDIVFLDPPYRSLLLERALRFLAESSLLSEQALVIAEHPAGDPPGPLGGLVIASQKRYGKTVLSFVQREMSKSPG